MPRVSTFGTGLKTYLNMAHKYLLKFKVYFFYKYVHLYSRPTVCHVVEELEVENVSAANRPLPECSSDRGLRWCAGDTPPRDSAQRPVFAPAGLVPGRHDVCPPVPHARLLAAPLHPPPAPPATEAHLPQQQ